MPTTVIQPSTKDGGGGAYSGELTDKYGLGVGLINTDYVGGLRRTWITFDTTEYTLGSAGINSAKLRLYYYDYYNIDPVGKQINVYKMLRGDWVESEACGSYYKGTTPWTGVCCGDSTSDYTTTNSTNTTVPASYGWMEWNITNIVKDAIDNVSGIVNLLVRYNDETKSGGNYSNINWHSNNYTDDTTLRPKLVIIAGTDYSITTQVGQFILTGINATFAKAHTYIISSTVGQFILTGISAILIGTGLAFRWKNQTKHNSTIKNNSTKHEI